MTLEFFNNILLDTRNFLENLLGGNACDEFKAYTELQGIFGILNNILERIKPYLDLSHCRSLESQILREKRSTSLLPSQVLAGKQILP